MPRDYTAQRASSLTNPWGLTVMQRWTLEQLVRYGSLSRAAHGTNLSIHTLEEHIRVAKKGVLQRQGRRLTTLQLVVEYSVWKEKGQPAPEPPATTKKVK